MSGVLVIILLYFLPRAIYYLPDAVLASFVITAAGGLFDFKGMRKLWREDRRDLVVRAVLVTCARPRHRSTTSTSLLQLPSPQVPLAPRITPPSSLHLDTAMATLMIRSTFVVLRGAGDDVRAAGDVARGC
jgi:hypothetical protein